MITDQQIPIDPHPFMHNESCGSKRVLDRCAGEFHVIPDAIIRHD